MKNKELIEKLLRYPLTTEVYFSDINYGDALVEVESEDITYRMGIDNSKILISSPQQDLLD